MSELASHRHAAATMPALPSLFLAACVALLSACSSPQHASTSPGTTPAIWTGSPAPSATGNAEGAPAAAPTITTHLKAPDGTQVATAKFEFSNGYATVTIETTGPGQLSPGFHGVHIHKAGKCEPNSVAPTGGAPGDFLSAGGHFQVPGHAAEPASGNLTSLQVRKDGLPSGANALMHEADVVVKVDTMRWSLAKSRYQDLANISGPVLAPPKHKESAA